MRSDGQPAGSVGRVWNVGILEDRRTGIVEGWNNGIMGHKMRGPSIS
jgi:hypothetical protein